MLILPDKTESCWTYWTELRSRKDFDKNFLLSVCTTYTEANRSCLFLTIDWPRDIACICQIKYSLVSSPILLLKPIFGHSSSSSYFHFNFSAFFLSAMLSHVARESHDIESCVTFLKVTAKYTYSETRFCSSPCFTRCHEWHEFSATTVWLLE